MATRRDTLKCFDDKFTRTVSNEIHLLSNSGTLRILDGFQFSDGSKVREFVLENQGPATGGLGKWDASSPDPLHSYLGLAGLSFVGKDKLREIFVPLNISMRAYKKLEGIHAAWEAS